jgi:hypothetical protein
VNKNPKLPYYDLFDGQYHEANSTAESAVDHTEELRELTNWMATLIETAPTRYDPGWETDRGLCLSEIKRARKEGWL